MWRLNGIMHAKCLVHFEYSIHYIWGIILTSATPVAISVFCLGLWPAHLQFSHFQMWFQTSSHVLLHLNHPHIQHCPHPQSLLNSWLFLSLSWARSYRRGREEQERNNTGFRALFHSELPLLNPLLANKEVCFWSQSLLWTCTWDTVLGSSHGPKQSISWEYFW